jgi:hypothetical protein
MSILIIAGIIPLLGAIFNWDWFMNSRKAKVMVKVLSRTGARFIYGAFGLTFVVFGILGAISAFNT